MRYRSSETVQRSGYFQSSVSDLSNWMFHNKLKLKGDKTEFLLVGSKIQTSKLIKSDISVGDHIISGASVAKNLGVWIDRSLTFQHQTHQVCKLAYKQIFMMYKIRPLITQGAAQTLVQALVTSKLDYGNALYFGISKSLLHKLQFVQNATARLFCGVRQYNHITQVLRALQWLPIQYRIDYKIILLCFKAIDGLAQGYITDLLQLHRPAQSLQSNSLNLLEVPRTRCKTFGDCAFSAVAPRLWNRIQAKLRAQNSILVFKNSIFMFKKDLKTYLFKILMKNWFLLHF